MIKGYSPCMLCPRRCGTDRSSGGRGFCGETAEMRASCVTLHRGEEPPLSGRNGSAAFFFTGCTLRCSFCQNRQISREGIGAGLPLKEFKRLALLGQEGGAATVSLVTATHFAPSVVNGIRMARSDGLEIPVVWNTSGYENIRTLEMIDPEIDIYLPDIKTLNANFSNEVFSAADYPEHALDAVSFMVEKKPLKWPGMPWSEVTDVEGSSASPVDSGTLTQGVIVRHLVLPGRMPDTRDVLRWYAEHIGDRALLSLMVQFIPPGRECFGSRAPGITPREYDRLLDWLDEFGLEEGFLQDAPAGVLGTGTLPAHGAEWLPDFSRNNPFPREYSDVLWNGGADSTDT